MATVLGIDAAWTASQPSGVALVRQSGGAWSVLAAAPSYRAFVGVAEGRCVDWAENARGSLPDVQTLLQAAARLGGGLVEVVAVDMPLSNTTITCRRTCDTAVSVRFGARGCSTHSPTLLRPGAVGENLMRQLDMAGYPLALEREDTGTAGRTIEVYPHPALLALLGRSARVPYKVSRARRYWPSADRRTRIGLLLQEYRAIKAALAVVVGPAPLPLPDGDDVATLAALKPYEDGLDALVCAWVGCEYLEKRAEPLGDTDAAIWIPTGTR